MRFVLSGLLALSPLASPVRAGPGSQAVREAAEFVTRKFGKEVAAEGAEVFARRLGRAALTHGDDVLNAARKCGPRAVRLIEEAGAPPSADAPTPTPSPAGR